eukprot:11029996-Alexandrium_andersonii.AAC.1
MTVSLSACAQATVTDRAVDALPGRREHEGVQHALADTVRQATEPAAVRAGTADGEAQDGR